MAVSLPDGRSFSCEPVLQDPEGELAGYWGVEKDSGDDPDVTDGIWVCAMVVPVSREEFTRLCREGRGYVLREYPCLYLNGGRGIGVVTKPGLACPPGHYAINPVPRAMILKAVQEVVKAQGYRGFLEIRLALPRGEELAARTFNPHLGIQGGISILGTTGIVEPMSEQALVETIRLDIRTKAWENRGVLLMTPGNYGSRYLREAFGIPEGQAVKCSNFVRDSVEMLAEEGILRLLFVGHAGKLVKVAGGVENTHSRYGDRRMEILGDLVEASLEKTETSAGRGQKPMLSRGGQMGQTGCAGATPDMPEGEKRRLLEAVRQANTTDEAMEILDGYGLAVPVLTLMARQVKRYMEVWGKGALAVEVIAFSPVRGLAGRTDQAEQFLASACPTWRNH